MKSINDKLGRVAIIADQMSAFGGADREMYSMLKVLPNADIFTITFNKEKYPDLKQKVYTSWVQKLQNILPKNFSRHLKIFTPYAYESFDLRAYDYVISLSAGPGKSVITGIDQPHIAMVMTPPRSLWDNELNARGSKLKWIYKPISKLINHYHRIWDYTSSKRVDYWTANSKYIQKKIKKIYGVDATVIYPGVEEKYYYPGYNSPQSTSVSEIPGLYALVVSRLYDHKRIDWAIQACKNVGKELVIIGEGPDRGYLEKIANKDIKIHFLGYIPDDEVIKYYQHAEVLLFCGLEDFGLTPVEAMAGGTPVLGYKDGGLLETIKPGITGEFFKTEKELEKLLKKFNKSRYNGKQIREHAAQFSEDLFLKNFERYLLEVYEQEQRRKQS